MSGGHPSELPPTECPGQWRRVLRAPSMTLHPRLNPHSISSPPPPPPVLSAPHFMLPECHPCPSPLVVTSLEEGGTDTDHRTRTPGTGHGGQPQASPSLHLCRLCAHCPDSKSLYSLPTTDFVMHKMPWAPLRTSDWKTHHQSPS